MSSRMRDVVSIDDCMSSGSDLEMHPSGRNKAPLVVGVAKSSKSLSFDLGEDIEERDEQVEDTLIAIQAPRNRPTNKKCLPLPPS